MRVPAERVWVDSMMIGIERMGGVQNVVDGLERVVGVDQWMMREVEEQKRMAMQSVEETAGAADAVVVAAVVVEVVVGVDKSSSDGDQRSINDECNVEKI